MGYSTLKNTAFTQYIQTVSEDGVIQNPTFETSGNYSITFVDSAYVDPQQGSVSVIKIDGENSIWVDHATEAQHASVADCAATANYADCAGVASAACTAECASAACTAEDASAACTAECAACAYQACVADSALWAYTADCAACVYNACYADNAMVAYQIVDMSTQGSYNVTVSTITVGENTYEVFVPYYW